MDIKQIEKDGFIIEETKSNMGNIALLSLRTALKAFFSTYQTVHYTLRNITVPPNADERDNGYSRNYIEYACSAIINFQHFTELILKDILKREHVLLSVDTSDKPVLLYDLLKGKTVDEAEIQQLKQIEAAIALRRVCTLIENGKIDTIKYGFIKSYRPFLESLNHLRNRILHRGVYVLRYKALDLLFVKYALPFMVSILKLPEYSKYTIWKMRTISIKIDLLDELIKSGKKGKYEIYRIALLKELGRAAYENPLRLETKPTRKKFSGFDKEIVQRAEKQARQIERDEYLHGIKICPVCDVESLVLFHDTFEELNDEGEVVGLIPYVYKVQCFCCSFEIYNEIEKLDKMKIPIDNYWSL